MRVQRLVMPGSGVESWTVLGDDYLPVEPVERFLAYLGAIERSPNTVKAYAHDLKDWFVFLDGRGVNCGGHIGRRRRVRRVAAAAASGTGRPGRGVAVGGNLLQCSECESQTRSVDVVLRVPRPTRRAVVWSAGHPDTEL